MLGPFFIEREGCVLEERADKRALSRYENPQRRFRAGTGVHFGISGGEVTHKSLVLGRGERIGVHEGRDQYEPTRDLWLPRR